MSDKNLVPLKDRMKIERTHMPERDAEVRSRNFEEVNLGLVAADALTEATRCISCAKPGCVVDCPVGVKIKDVVALTRLETLVLQAGIDMPLKAVRQNIVGALDFIVFVARLSDGSRRVLQVAEVTGLEVETVSMADLFLLDLRRGAGGLEGSLRALGTIPRFYERLRRQGEEPPLQFFRGQP